MKDGISVVICCYNSAPIIEETLGHLIEQQVDDQIAWEVIIVDNYSTDNTSGLAKNYLAKTSVDFKVIQEKKVGLAHARAAGVLASNYDYVIFCDDDNWLSTEYIRIAYYKLKSNSRIGVLGGRGIPVFESEEPEWFNDYKSFYAVGSQGQSAGDISERNYVWGAGMVLRKELYKKLLSDGIESKLSDRKGHSLSSGGDSEISVLYLICGYRLWYDPALQFHHYISANKLTINYRDRLIASLAESTKVLHQLFRISEHVLKEKSIFLRCYEVLRISTSFAASWIMKKLSIEKKHFYISQLQLLAGAWFKLHPFFFELLKIRSKYRVKS